MLAKLHIYNNNNNNEKKLIFFSLFLTKISLLREKERERERKKNGF
jgi:hypothetical protein